MLLVVGLGNPGPRYAATRHNAGFMVVDELASRGGQSFRPKFSGELCEVKLAGEPVLLLKPLTFMNESGRSVRAVASFYKIALSSTLVVHDELDVPFGELRLKQGGGDAGHRGLRSITAHLGSGDYLRLRFGVGRPPPEFRGTPADFVLEAFASAEKAELAKQIASAADATELLAGRGLAPAMNTVNQRKPR
ncbi:MAG TPA: aminoacyl-tRNA hydrolase [Polyangiaceae bacterium]|nr:aminoacyl-tRNA hydrolase [Polyangiaceae bacterium]